MPRAQQQEFPDGIHRIAAEDSLRQAGRHIVDWLEEDVTRLDDLTPLERAAMDLISPALFKRFEGRLTQLEHERNEAERAKRIQQAKPYPSVNALNTD